MWCGKVLVRLTGSKQSSTFWKVLQHTSACWMTWRRKRKKKRKTNKALTGYFVQWCIVQARRCNTAFQSPLQSKKKANKEQLRNRTENCMVILFSCCFRYVIVYTWATNIQVAEKNIQACWCPSMCCWRPTCESTFTKKVTTNHPSSLQWFNLLAMAFHQNVWCWCPLQAYDQIEFFSNSSIFIRMESPLSSGQPYVVDHATKTLSTNLSSKQKHQWCYIIINVIRK